MRDLIGQRVMDVQTRHQGIITSLTENRMLVKYIDKTVSYPFPAALDKTLVLRDQEQQMHWKQASAEASFDIFKEQYIQALSNEISFLKRTGGKPYQIVDGVFIRRVKDRYLYRFECDSELHFPEGTGIRLRFIDRSIPAEIDSCEDFIVTIRTTEYLGERIGHLEFTADSWFLLQALIDRIDEMDADTSPIAYDLAVNGRRQIDFFKSITRGQNAAIRRATSEPITIIWGPPGTGKTRTLAQIAMEFVLRRKRVLMLSYSNVSVDGAMLKVASMSDGTIGPLVRYGYPRDQELLEKTDLTSYGYILSQNKELLGEYKGLLKEKNSKKREPETLIKINARISEIRGTFREEEKKLIQWAPFVATTVSKATSDKAIYQQKFDLVLFDEASMAYVPQVVFAAGLAKESFCCLGDFRQLSAIVQSTGNDLLERDIFEHTGVTGAVDDQCGHKWLVMLDTQYRMHPDIASFVGKSMYGGLLSSDEQMYEIRQPVAKLAPIEDASMGLIDLSGTYSVCIKTPDGSRINLLSALISMGIAEQFADKDKYDVALITPYSAQSRLILAMLRDLQEKDKRFSAFSCATVHQYQGSEKSVVVYDAVDCYRMSHAGVLITGQKHGTANRLFNVALTRSKGKFLVVSNVDYLMRKKLSNKLLFAQLLHLLKQTKQQLIGDPIIDELRVPNEKNQHVFIGERDEVDSWEYYIEDLNTANQSIIIELPGAVDQDQEALSNLKTALHDAEERGVEVFVRAAVSVPVPEGIFPDVERVSDLVATMPYTIIDQMVVWYGEPLSAANFVSEGAVIPTRVFPCVRIQGQHTARILRTFLGIPSLTSIRRMRSEKQQSANS